MKRALWLLPVVAAVAVWFWFRSTPKPAETKATAITQSTPRPPASLLGVRILREYGKATPRNDLTMMAHLMENYTLLVKTSRPLADNEDWAAALRGQNPAHEHFLPDRHAALNAAGQLVDRWGTPLFFHALGDGRYELRSAGPDREMWTADDIHRNADGSFLHGEVLNPPSLYESSPTR